MFHTASVSSPDGGRGRFGGYKLGYVDRLARSDDQARVAPWARVACAARRIVGRAGSVIWTMISTLLRRRIMSATAKLFMHGRSQAVRLPKEIPLRRHR